MILVTEFMDADAVALMRKHQDVVYDSKLADNQTDIPALMSGVSALIVRNRTKVTDQLLDAADDLKCVGRLGVGLDNIDLDACKARGVTVYPATGANNLSVAEYVISTAMQLLRSAYDVKAAMLAGAWPREACAGRELSGHTLGLVGYGAIAQDAATRARALGMTVAAYDPYLPSDHPAWQNATRYDLHSLMEVADVLSLHVPLTPETRHIIGAKEIAMMKESAVLINAARGGTVDETALADALRDGSLGGAALDVFETEPMTMESAVVFDGAPNLILTPHIAGVTVESNQRVSAMIAKKVLEHLRGE